MKISNVSKKVLCSALSAAMVVAFAPTVAFGTPIGATDTATVSAANVDLAGGTGTAADVTITGKTSQVNVGTLPTVTKEGYALTHWLLDGDGDATTTGDQLIIDQGAGDYTFVPANIDDTNATLKAVWAPTIANGTEVSVTFKENGGTVSNGGFGTLVGTVADGKLILPGLTQANAEAMYSKTGCTLGKWFVDTDNNGKKGTGEAEYDYTYGLPVVGIAQTSQIVLTANWAQAAFTENAANGFELYRLATDTASRNVTVNVNASGLEASTDYYAALTIAGESTPLATSAGIASDGSGVLTGTFNVDNSKLVAGTYTLTLYKQGSPVVVATYTEAVSTVTVLPGDYGYFSTGASVKMLVSDNVEIGASNAYDKAFTVGTTGLAVTSGYNLTGWKTSAGVELKKTDKISADTTIVAQYDVPGFGTATLTAPTAKTGTPSSLAMTANNLDKVDSANLEKYTVVISNGADSYTVNDVSKDATTIAATIHFDSANAGATTTGTTSATADVYTDKAMSAGKWTVTVTANYKASSGKGSKVVATGEADVASIAFDINGGTYLKDADKTDKQIFPQFALAGDAVADVVAAADAAVGTVFTKPQGVALKGWSLDGANLVVTTGAANKQSKFSSGSNTLTAIYESDTVAKPAVSVARQDDGSYLITAVAADGVKMTYDAKLKGSTKITGLTVPATGIVVSDLTKIDEVVITAAKAGLKPSTVTVSTPAATVTAFETFASNVLGEATADDQTAKVVKYNAVLSTVMADGVAALKATDFDTDANWTAALKAQEKIVVESVANYGKSQLEALKAFKKATDGKTYSYLADAEYANAVAAIDQVLADFDANASVPASTPKVVTGSALTAAWYGAPAGTTYATTGSGYGKAVTDAVDTAETKVTAVKAADAEAAIAVSDQLTAATTGEAAEAALAAYAALTDTQKELVSSADIAAAQAVVAKAAEEEKKAAEEEAKKAAQALVDAQDEGTLNKISGTKSKTYTLKSKKKTTSAHSISYTTTLSKSGNVVTYAKVSGAAKITVTEGGKVKLKKGAVKGKTYTAKVLAACGTQTRTVTVKFVIK